MSRSFGKTTAPNQQWHTDVMYVWVAARFYFLLSFVDAYNRYVMHHYNETGSRGACAADRCGPRAS